MIAALVLAAAVASLDPAALDPRALERWRACLARLAAARTSTVTELDPMTHELAQGARRFRACGLVAESGRVAAEDALEVASSSTAIAAAVERALERLPAVAPPEPPSTPWAIVVAGGAIAFALGVVAGVAIAH